MRCAPRLGLAAEQAKVKSNPALPTLGSSASHMEHCHCCSLLRECRCDPTRVALSSRAFRSHLLLYKECVVQPDQEAVAQLRILMLCLPVTRQQTVHDRRAPAEQATAVLLLLQ